MLGATRRLSVEIRRKSQVSENYNIGSTAGHFIHSIYIHTMSHLFIHSLAVIRHLLYSLPSKGTPLLYIIQKILVCLCFLKTMELPSHPTGHIDAEAAGMQKYKLTTQGSTLQDADCQCICFLSGSSNGN